VGSGIDELSVFNRIILNPALTSEIIPSVSLVRSHSHRIFRILKSPSKINRGDNLDNKFIRSAETIGTADRK
jgi:hypothetical protein